MKQDFNYFAFNECASAFKILGLDMDLTEYSTYLEENALDHNQIEAIDDFLYHLRDKKVKSTIEMYLKTSRLPFKVPKTFANFDFSAHNLIPVFLCVPSLPAQGVPKTTISSPT